MADYEKPAVPPDFDKKMYLCPCIDDEGFIRLYNPETGAVLFGQRDTGMNIKLEQPMDDILIANIEVIVDPRYINAKIKKNKG